MLKRDETHASVPLSESPSLFRIYGEFMKRLETLEQDYTAKSGSALPAWVTSHRHTAIAGAPFFSGRLNLPPVGAGKMRGRASNED